MPAMESLVGVHLNHYLIKEFVGRANLAATYLARHITTGEKSILNVVDLDNALVPADFQSRFQDSYEQLTLFHHANILDVTDGGIDKNFAYIATHPVEAQPLRQQMVGLRPEQIMRIVEQVTAALTYAHEQGVIHGALNPDHILLDQDLHVYVEGFICGLLRADSSLLIFGLPVYISPEQLRGEKISIQADIFCLGTLLYELFTGQPPFTGHLNERARMIYQQLTQSPAPPSSLAPGISARVDKVILKALERDPQDRFDSAADLFTALRAAIENPHRRSFFAALHW